MTILNWEYLEERIKRYDENPSDDLLYRIGTHTDVLTIEDCRFIESQGGRFSPEQRCRVLDWLYTSMNWEPKTDLALLIFGREQLTQWVQISRQAYPDFEFYLVFECRDPKKTGWYTGIAYTCFWRPKPGAPVPATDNDFPWNPYWDLGEVFWGEFPGDTTNDFEFTLSVYPNQESFTDSRWVLEEGDWQCIPTDEEADLMSVAQVLEQFTVSV